MGEGSSGGGGGDRQQDKREDRGRARAPAASQKPEPRPDRVVATPSRGGGAGRGGDPRQYGFNAADARRGQTGTSRPRLSFDTALSDGPRPSVQVPGVDVAATPPRLEAGYSTPSVQANRFLDTTEAMSRRGREGVRQSFDTLRTGTPAERALSLPALAFNAADAVAGGVAGLVADIVPGDSRATERSVARGIMSVPEAFMGVSPGRVTNVLDDALERVAESRRIADLGLRVAADDFRARYPSDNLGTFEGAFLPGNAQNLDLMQRAQTGALTGNETDYLNRMGVAAGLEARGLNPRQVYEQTGILSVPMRTLTGDVTPGGRTLSFTTTPTVGGRSTASIDRAALNEVLDQNRTARLRDIMGLPENLRGGVLPAAATRTPVRAQDLPEGTVGGFDPTTGSIALSRRPSDRSSMAPTLQHEVAHDYLFESDIPLRAVGTSPEAQAQQARQALAQIDREVSAAERAFRSGDIDDFQLQEVRDAAAAQRASLLRSPMELYSENLGEIIARRAEGDTSQYVTAGLREAFNPYISTSSGISAGAPLRTNIARGVRAPIEQGLFALRQFVERPSATPALQRSPIGPVQSYGILAEVPSNIFERSNTGSRVPVYTPPAFSGATPGTGIPRFDLNAFD